MQFSLDGKRRSHIIIKQNLCSASDSVGLIFTRSYRSTLLHYDSDSDSVASKNQPFYIGKFVRAHVSMTLQRDVMTLRIFPKFDIGKLICGGGILALDHLVVVVLLVVVGSR